jgi:glycerophosphoryl diester phosphodiesterase
MSWGGEIVGHRGAAGVAPENTLPSFEAAIAAGADRVELDVRRTLDGHAVVFHDATPDRFHPPAAGRAVNRHALAEMRSIRVGGAAVPSFDELLEAVHGRVLLNVEIKGTGHDGSLVLGLALDALRRHAALGATVLSSFHPSIVAEAAACEPSLPRALIVDARFPADAVCVARSLGCEGLHPAHRLVDDALVARCRAAGLRLRSWTANADADVLRLMDLGVDGIVSDLPGRVRELRDTMRVP